MSGHYQNNVGVHFCDGKDPDFSFLACLVIAGKTSEKKTKKNKLCNLLQNLLRIPGKTNALRIPQENCRENRILGSPKKFDNKMGVQSWPLDEKRKQGYSLWKIKETKACNQAGRKNANITYRPGDGPHGVGLLHVKGVGQKARPVPSSQGKQIVKARPLQCGFWPRTPKFWLKFGVGVGWSFLPVFFPRKKPNKFHQNIPCKLAWKLVRKNAPRTSAEALPWQISWPDIPPPRNEMPRISRSFRGAERVCAKNLCSPFRFKSKTHHRTPPSLSLSCSIALLLFCTLARLFFFFFFFLSLSLSILLSLSHYLSLHTCMCIYIYTYTYVFSLSLSLSFSLSLYLSISLLSLSLSLALSLSLSPSRALSLSISETLIFSLSRSACLFFLSLSISISSQLHSCSHSHVPSHSVLLATCVWTRAILDRSPQMLRQLPHPSVLSETALSAPQSFTNLGRRKCAF